MRIGIDCQALQTPGSRQRGIGIYARSIIHKLASFGQDELHLFFSEAFPVPDMRSLSSHCHTVAFEQPLNAPGVGEANEYLQRLAYESYDLDVLFVPSPVDGADAVIDSCLGNRNFALVCTLHDLIPLLFPAAYLSDPARKRLYLRQLELYRRSDLILAVSEHSRRDGIRLLNIPDDRIITVREAADPAFGQRDRESYAELLEAGRRKHGIRSRFILFTGGFDFRKNMDGMLRAFSLLPQRLRREYQLVMVCALNNEQEALLQDTAAQLGIEASLVLTNYISQDLLIALLNSCDLFVFPSLYEGFGLPVLEAMSCGAPVVASNTSSLPEIVGDAGMLVDPADPRALAHMMQLVLESENLKQELSRKALQRAKLFRWDVTARATREGFEQARAQRQRSLFVARDRKPKIAFFSPLPPQRSGISDYSAELLPYLAKHFEIDVYLDGYTSSGISRNRSIRFFSTPENLQESSYYSFVFQMGNSPFHGYIYDVLLQHPGVTVLHDLFLHDLVDWLFTVQRHDRQRYLEELIYEQGEAARIATEMLGNNELDDGWITKLFPLNERLLCASKAVVVHSAFARSELLKGRSSQLSARVRHIHQGMSVPALPAPEQGMALRTKLSIPADAFVIGTFGIISQSKQMELGLRTIARLRRQCAAYYIGVGDFVSPDYEASIRRLCEELGITNRVTFTGHVSREDFYNYLFVCNAVLSLRYPSRGETSGSMLRALSCGVPTILTDCGASSEIPAEVAVKVKVGPKQEEELLEALRLLAEDKSFARRLGAAARQHILDHHSWEIITEQYADFIQRVETTGLGDQTRLREVIACFAEQTRRQRKAGAKKLNRLVDVFAVNEGLGRVLWV